MPVNRLKTTYQRNMALGLLTASLLFFTPFIFIHFLTEPEEIIAIKADDVIFSDYIIKKGLREDITTIANLSYKSHIINESRKSAVGRENPIEPNSPPIPSANISYRPSLLNDEFRDELSSYYGEYLSMDTIGENYHCAPGIDDYPVILATQPVPENSGSDKYISNFYSEKSVRRMRPVLFKVPAYIPRLPALYDGEEAVLLFRITIDEKGKILEIETLHENPPDRGFASAIKSVIKTDAFIEPPLKNGQPYGCSFVFSWQHQSGKSAISVKSTDEIMVSLKRQD